MSPDLSPDLYSEERPGPLQRRGRRAPQTAQTPYSLKRIADPGYGKLFTVFDRGYCSEDGLAALNRLKDLEYGVLCPDDTDWADGLFRKHGPRIRDNQNCYIPEENVYGKRCSVTLFKKKYYAYLFYDSDRAEKERSAIHGSVAFFREEASGRTRYTDKMQKHYEKRGIIVAKTEKDPETGRNFTLSEDTEKISELLNRAGLFAMLSPVRLEPAEAMRIIRNRDKSEKPFLLMPEHCHPSGACLHGGNLYRGLMFTAFIADIVLASFAHFERQLLGPSPAEAIPHMLLELNRYKIERNAEGTWRPAFAMNSRQKEIFSKLGVTEKDAQKSIAAITML